MASSCDTCDTWDRWLDADEYRLNMDIFRARRHFAKKGIEDAAQLVERRIGTGQLRIGVERLSIEGLR